MNLPLEAYERLNSFSEQLGDSSISKRWTPAMIVLELNNIRELIDDANEPPDDKALRIAETVAKQHPGQLINAIKALRNETGCDLRTAHAIMVPIYKELEEHPMVAVGTPKFNKIADEIAMANPGEKIQAMKELRLTTGCGWEESYETMLERY